jgi:hypothetical protein
MAISMMLLIEIIALCYRSKGLQFKEKQKLTKKYLTKTGHEKLSRNVEIIRTQVRALRQLKPGLSCN